MRVNVLSGRWSANPNLSQLADVLKTEIFRNNYQVIHTAIGWFTLVTVVVKSRYIASMVNLRLTEKCPKPTMDYISYVNNTQRVRSAELLQCPSGTLNYS